MYIAQLQRLGFPMQTTTAGHTTIAGIVAAPHVLKNSQIPALIYPSLASMQRRDEAVVQDAYANIGRNSINGSVDGALIQNTGSRRIAIFMRPHDESSKDVTGREEESLYAMSLPLLEALNEANAQRIPTVAILDYFGFILEEDEHLVMARVFSASIATFVEDPTRTPPVEIVVRFETKAVMARFFGLLEDDLADGSV